MRKFIAPWIGRKSKCVPAPELNTGATGAVRAGRGGQAARSLAAGLQRAMELGLWEHAERIAKSAQPLAGHYPSLCEHLTRLRLAQDNPERALASIDSCAMRTASLRLLRDVCLLQLGRRDEAHLDLRAWAGRSSAPLAARTMLALLEWQIGDSEAAIATLLRNLRQIEDPQSLAVLMLMNAANSRDDAARYWADRLQKKSMVHNSGGPADDINLMLRSIGIIPERSEYPVSHDGDAESLAIELLASEQVLPALVEAQRLDPSPAAIEKLAEAIERILPELSDGAGGYAALASLHKLLGENEAAAQWARQGIQRFPMALELARVLQDLEREGHDRGARVQEIAA